jgi:hypothetical protein
MWPLLAVHRAPELRRAEQFRIWRRKRKQKATVLATNRSEEVS